MSREKMPAARPNAVRVDLGDRVVERVERESPTPRARRSPRTGSFMSRRDVDEDRRLAAARRRGGRRRTSVRRCATASRTHCSRARRFRVADHRPDVGVADRADRRPAARGRARRASRETARARERCTNSRWVDVQACPARRNAELRNARRRAIEIGVLADDRRRRCCPARARSGRRPDVAMQLLADARAAGEGVEANLLVLDQPAARLRCPGPAPG